MGFGKILIPVLCLICIVGFFLVRGAIVDLKKTNEKLTEAEQTAIDTPAPEPRFTEPALPAQTEPEPQSEVPAEAQPIPAEEPGFPCYLRVTDGKIGVFSVQGYLLQRWEVDVRTLPAVDRAALEAGVAVASRAELIARMEDYRA